MGSHATSPLSHKSPLAYGGPLWSFASQLHDADRKFPSSCTWHTFQENGVRKKLLGYWVNNLNLYHNVSVLKPETDRNWAFLVFS